METSPTDTFRSACCGRSALGGKRPRGSSALLRGRLCADSPRQKRHTSTKKCRLGDGIEDYSRTLNQRVVGSSPTRRNSQTGLPGRFFLERGLKQLEVAGIGPREREDNSSNTVRRSADSKTPKSCKSRNLGQQVLNLWPFLHFFFGQPNRRSLFYHRICK